MIIVREEDLRNFDFWSGGEETYLDLTNGQIDIIDEHLQDLYPDGMDETAVNDFFWFERDLIAEWLGFNDYDELLEANAKLDAELV